MIEVKNLDKFYGNKSVLSNVSFNVKKSTVCGLMGKNGAGKSTLLNILYGNLDYTGIVTISDQNPHEYKKLNFSKTFFLTDSPHIYEYLTPKEYIQFVLEAKHVSYSKKYDQLIQLSKLFEIENNLDQLICQFSLGMKRKILLLAIALLQPEFLIMDEPTSGLDAPSVVVFKSFLSSLAKSGCTIIVSSHEPDFLRNICDQILILHDHVLAYGSSTVKQDAIDLNQVYLKIIGSDIESKISLLLSN